MARSWSDTLQDLRAAEHLARSLEKTAPGAVALDGGGDELVRLHGRPTGALFWRLEGNVEAAVKDCARAVLRAVVEATPIDTGLARSNWTPELDRAFEGLFPARVPGAAGSTAEATAAATVEAGQVTIDAFDLRSNASIHITNNALHIRSLDDGHSQQAPAGFVRIAVMEGLATVRDARVLDD